MKPEGTRKVLQQREKFRDLCRRFQFETHGDGCRPGTVIAHRLRVRAGRMQRYIFAAKASKDLPPALTASNSIEKWLAPGTVTRSTAQPAASAMSA